MARRSTSRTPLGEGERGSSFDSVSSVSTTQHTDDDLADDQDQHSSVNEVYVPTKACAGTEAKTLSCSSSFSSDRTDTTPSWKQGLLILTVYFLGCCTGAAHVKYGLEKNTSQTPHLSTSHLPVQTSDLSVPKSVQVNEEASRKKKLVFNRDNSGFQQRPLPTLFGLEYNSVIGSVDIDNSAATHEAITPEVQVPATWYNLASNKPVSLSPPETKMIQSVSHKVHETFPNLEERAAKVSWGGPHNAVAATNWWSPKTDSNPSLLSGLDGGHSLYAYLFIMKWDPHPHFPFRLCGEEGCPPERALAHTLEWREKYRPWLVPPSVVKENNKGYVYHRGLSPAATESEKHSIVWLRLGGIAVHDNLAFFRGILNAADRAIAEALIASNGETGKFNVVIDCSGFSLSGTPALQAVKQGVTMLQDHYPNRLGMIHLAGLARSGEMFLNVVLRLITKEVRDKVKILPNSDKAKTLAILKTVVDEQFIPDWLGGTDTYRFNAEEYYPEHLRFTEEEAHEFLTTMPYHAK